MSANATTSPAPPENPGGRPGPVRLLPRPLQRTRRLPSTRAVVGALLVVGAAAATLALAGRDRGAATSPYVVVTRSVAPGTRLTSDMLGVERFALGGDAAGQAYRDPIGLVGAVALGPLGAGQLVQRAEVAPANTSAGTTLTGHELTVPVDPDRLPPALKRGERVAVLATYGGGNDASTVVVAQRAVVLAVDEPSTTLGASRAQRLTISLAEPAAVIEIAHASQAAHLTVVRATQTDEKLPASFASPTKAKG